MRTLLGRLGLRPLFGLGGLHWSRQNTERSFFVRRHRLAVRNPTGAEDISRPSGHSNVRRVQCWALWYGNDDKQLEVQDHGTWAQVASGLESVERPVLEWPVLVGYKWVKASNLSRKVRHSSRGVGRRPSFCVYIDSGGLN